MKPEKTCIFCGNNGPYNSIEHIVPEGLDNDDLILENNVCDTCNQYFGSKIESYVLNSTPIGVWRNLLRITGKKKKLPKFSKAHNKDKGRFPKAHETNDIFSIKCHKDGTASISMQDEDIAELINGKKADFKIVFTPYIASMVGRFLLKISLELLCHRG